MSIPENRTSIPPFPAPDQRESEAQFWELMTHLHQAFWIKNAADTAVLYVSPAYERIWGRSRASLYDGSHTFLDSIHPDDHERVAAAMARKQETEGYAEEYRILRPDGSIRWIWARTYPVRDEHAAIKRYAGIAEDISERKWAEKERSRLAAIIEYTEDAIVSITMDGIIIAWNNGAHRKYGYAAEEVIGHSILVLIPPEQAQEYLSVMKRVRNGEQVAAYDTMRRRKDGTLISLSVGIAPIEARDGKVVGISKIGHDISQVRTLEAQLIEAQKMEIIGQLTGGVAHDFNNVLAVILGNGELIMQQLGPDHSLRQSMAAIQRAAERGAGLTRQLLIFSRKETVQFAVLDLNEVLQNLDGMMRQLVDDSIELTVTPGVLTGQIKADLGYVGQVLMNLVVNARDAMPGGGQLGIATSDFTLDETFASQHPGAACGDYVMLSVSDTGTGMSDEVKAHLFEPFFTTKQKGRGTGLGLATCQTIVQKCDGHIGVSSDVGRGTTFKIYFPCVIQPSVSTARPFPPGPLPRGTEALLVVEDDSEVRLLVCGVLRSQGYTVLAAANGEAGLRAVLDHEGPEIRLVISDVIMPQMGGQVMADWLKTRNPELKVLFTSGYTDDAIAHHGVLDPRIAFLSKPYSIATLAHKVRELLDAPPTQALR
ncbi:MAG: PAS domain S-box protein [Opitutaceae bacterium]|nr:PAS domain S-box protein [Opitutaceae bacterium]